MSYQFPFMFRRNSTYLSLYSVLLLTHKYQIALFHLYKHPETEEFETVGGITRRWYAVYTDCCLKLTQVLGIISQMNCRNTT